MFISSELLANALDDLKSIHPFYGITYLVCKMDNLPVGTSIKYFINAEETSFLNEYYKPLTKTEKFFRVFRPSEKRKYWLNADYASSGSQANRTQMFSDAFIHPRGSNLWGWTDNYLEVLAKHLGKRKIPMCSLAFWILKKEDWPKDSRISDIIDVFIERFNLSESELDSLFDLEIPSIVKNDIFLNIKQYDWNKISEILEIPNPPDIPIEKGGALMMLELNGIDFSKDFHLDLANRLNIITGDNGLGKSFILEAAWWALTQTWTDFPIYPKNEIQNLNPSITFSISSSAGRNETYHAKFDWRSQNWKINIDDKKNVPGLVIYARVDGAFAIWDPARLNIDNQFKSEVLPSTLVFSREDIWNGVHIGEGSKIRSIFNGIITDWVHWQNANSEAFAILKKVLKRLSPPDLRYGDLGILAPGDIVRIPGESRPIPTIKHPYGEVPIIFASAAVKRIVALSYLIVWTWEEHKTSARLMRESPQTKMVVIADEIESHLHPQWQRVILPSLTSISDDLSDKLSIQFLVTTHSPLVMASIEPFFEEPNDKIFHLNLKLSKNKPVVVLETPKFEKRGSANSWLISDIFELKQPRSIEAEAVIEEAKTLQMQDNPSKISIKEIHQKLMKLLAPHDTFWIRWNYFAEKKGVEL